MDYEDDEERKNKAASAAYERREVWVGAVMAQLGSGRHPQEATGGADTVLEAFDVKFPGLVKAILDHEEPDADDDPE